MKMTQEHFQHMQRVLAEVDTPELRQMYIDAGLSTTLYQWNMIRRAGLMGWVCDTLYKYLNDNHIQTALNRIIKPLQP